MMWTYFHTTLNDDVLFKFWRVQTAGDMAITCAIMFSLAFFVELLKHIRGQIERKAYLDCTANSTYSSRLTRPSHLLQTALFFVQLIFSYMLMLVVMTFSLWLIAAILLGTGLGQYIFVARSIADSSGHPALANAGF
ncbi:unnamed protein product [Bursaphelenchus xylophilus]|uniref:Copper transport protein n=1 Tax=Bursaphelenchus xylophilus TaxID=6326 RepID=A0A1I7SXB7_BURXY|nr:unnamed protein product [Bursaphelenchus xylophilus]CAG9100312.1 unnamed protein product [Bursaphelenchus xylophilus]